MRRGILPLNVLGCALALWLASCRHDAADSEYLAALAGEEEGWTREEQIERIDSAIALVPTRPRYWETRAIYRIDLRDFARAEADLDRAIELGDRPYLRFLRGLVRCQAGRHVEALAEFDAAIAAEPGNAQFYRGRTLARVETGDPGGGLEDAERLVALAPRAGDSYYARGKALAELDRWPEALAHFDEAIVRRPELVFPWAARADCRDRLGDAAGAASDRAEAEGRRRRSLQLAVNIDPFRY